jgi:hypothetical protein
LNDEQAVRLATDDPTLQAEVSELRKELVGLESRSQLPTQSPTTVDPDDARRLVEESKSIRGRIGRVERKASASNSGIQSIRFTQEVELAETIVSDYGTPLDKMQLAAYKRELERFGSKGDDRAIARLTEDIGKLRWRVLLKQDWYWVDVLDRLAEPGNPFTDQAAADALIQSGRTAAGRADSRGLRDAVRALWKLQPKSTSDELRERSLESGLRKF